MPHRPTRDWDEDDWDDESVDDEESDTIPCPHCRRLIHEDAQRCPHCENWLTEEDDEASPPSKPTWFVITALVCLLIVILWVLGG